MGNEDLYFLKLVLPKRKEKKKRKENKKVEEVIIYLFYILISIKVYIKLVMCVPALSQVYFRLI